MTTQTAGISEVFSSLQGEGTHIGERHLFVRFETCNIHCEYCDELGKTSTTLQADELVSKIIALDRTEGPHQFVSFTGGEPLVYSQFAKELAIELRRTGFRIYLETNGILSKQLASLIEHIDVVAMDLKPASVTKERKYVKEHQEFLKIASLKETFVKMVISNEIDIEEYVELCHLVKITAPHTPIILQPISTNEKEGHDDLELMNLLNHLQCIGNGIIPNIRIVPRLHKILKIK